jgi:hypothetical protein
MANWLQRLFARPTVKTLPLTFTMDMNEVGQHVVKVQRCIHDEPEPITDIRALFAYGYREVADDGRTLYLLIDDQRQTLQALRSLNPDIRPNGEMVFDIVPPVLRYLRSRRAVQEGDLSKELQIIEEPIRPIATVDFNPASGLQVEAGYVEPGTNTMVHADQLQKTSDGNYVRIGKTFVRLPKLSEAASKLLSIATQTVPLSGIPEFFLRDMVLLKTEFQSVLTDLARQVRVISEPPQVTVQINKGQPGWLDFKVNYQMAGFTLPHGLLAEKNDAFHQVNPHTWIAIDRQAVDRVEHELKELEAAPTVDGYRIPATDFASLEEFISATGGQAEMSDAYRQFIDQLTNFRGDEHYPLPETIEHDLGRVNITLRPYQRAGIQWLHWLYTNGLHGILADSMGLGKTIQTIVTLRLVYETSGSTEHSLILAPKSVLPHWQREITRYYPQAHTYLYHGPSRERSLLLSKRPIIFISTYATAAHEIDQLARVPFLYVILDEATFIKNRDSLRSQAVKALNSAHRLALSGTPVENRPSELWSLFDFLMRGHLGRYGTFARVFESAILAGDQMAAERLGRRVQPFLLRRRKEDVAKDLPEKIEVDEWCELTDEQRQLYGGLQDKVKRIQDALRRGEQVNYTANILPVLTKLKQICDHPALVAPPAEPIEGRSEKFDWILEKISDICEAGEQVLVFSHFLGMLNLLEAAMRAKDVSYIRIDGSTQNRQALIDRFNQGHASVGLLSLMAAGHGINLTAANHVIHADRWWNPAVEDQATDRVHRIGQTRTVYVYRILTQGTLEERIDQLLESKRGMADQIISAARGGLGEWTREVLLEILKPLD